MKNLIVMMMGNGKARYCRVVKSNGFAKGIKNVISLGSESKLSAINERYLEIFREKIKEISDNTEPKTIKKMMLDHLCSLKEKNFITNIGINIFYDVIKKLEIFSSLKKSKHKNLEELLKYQIASRILQNTSIIKSFETKDNYLNDIESKKDTFYSLLDVLYENEIEIVKNLNNKIAEMTSRNKNLVYFDATTVYFETFSRDGLRTPGFSKDGKFKEDQVVVGMATDSNGIPIYLKVFRGNTADGNTLIPFILHLREKFTIKSMTVIADKGMSTNKNIRFLESIGIDYIFAQRLKSTSKSFKDFVFDSRGYTKTENGIKYKELEFQSLWKGSRFNDNFRRRIIFFSEKRAAKDKNDRQILINNFKKKQNKEGVVSAEDIIGVKKYKFFKKVGNMSFTLDLDKIEDDEKFDGYYVYETSRKDLKPEQIASIYHKQYQIEENFRTLKGALSIRPIYVRTHQHIIGHFILNFIALVVLKYTIYAINNFYYNNGVIEKYTNESLITLLNSCFEYTQNINNKTATKKFVEINPFISNIEKFKEINTIIKNGM